VLARAAGLVEAEGARDLGEGGRQPFGLDPGGDEIEDGLLAGRQFVHGYQYRYLCG
jgi:hypothetical protein